MAIDRVRLVDTTFAGYGRVYPGLAWPFIFERAPSWPPTVDELGPWWQYDPTEAKKLLTAAGVEDRLPVETGTFSRSQTTASPDEQNALVVEFLRDVGIDFSIVEQPDNSQTQSRQWLEAASGLRKGRQWLEEGREMQSGSIVGIAPTTSAFYHAMVHSQSPRNFDGINDPEIDEWAEQQRVETDPELRKGILQKIWDKSQDEVYRVEWASAFRFAILAGSVRYWRMHGPLITNYMGDFGRHWERGWLDK